MYAIKFLFLVVAVCSVSSLAWADTADDAQAILAEGGDTVVETLAELGAVSPESAAVVIEQVARRQPRMLPEVLQAISFRMDDPEAFDQAVSAAEQALADDPSLQVALRAARGRTQTAFANRENCPGRSCENGGRRGEPPDPRGPPEGNGPPSSEPVFRVNLDVAILGTEAGVSTELECLQIGCDLDVGLEVNPAPPLDPPASPM